jgi:hypothetical protein
MKININDCSKTNYVNVNQRCPHCGHIGSFDTVPTNDLIISDRTYIFYMGIRKCPNRNCSGHLFFIMNNNGQVIFSSPSELIPFESDNIPNPVLKAFEEAIKCHSNTCYIASAIMIRKTLEEICHDRNSNGKNLKERIKDLGTKIMIPKELIDGLDDLRLLGNDAAHVEAATFSEIGKEEIEISIDFTKEILKAVYQYENLLERLKKLKNKNEA